MPPFIIEGFAVFLTQMNILTMTCARHPRRISELSHGILPVQESCTGMCGMLTAKSVHVSGMDRNSMASPALSYVMRGFEDAGFPALAGNPASCEGHNRIQS
jgi:hypothetical protein